LPFLVKLSIALFSDNDPQDKDKAQVNPRDGKWTMQDRARKELYFNDGKKLEHWGLLDLTNCDDKSFVNALYDEGRKRGLSIEFPVVKKSNDRSLEKDFVTLFNELAKKRKPDMIMVIVWGKESYIYAMIKTMGDTIYKIPTQVILKKNTMIGPKSPQTIHNICLKLNAKLGGVNQIIHPCSKPEIFKRPVSLVSGYALTAT
jgi:eukaryotic translation initiation factor 2C